MSDSEIEAIVREIGARYQVDHTHNPVLAHAARLILAARAERDAMMEARDKAYDAGYAEGYDTAKVFWSRVARLLRICQAKRKYLDAATAARAVAKQARVYGKPMRSYRCDICRFYHLATEQDHPRGIQAKRSAQP